MAETTTTETTSRPTNDAYTGMLAIAMLALAGGSALMFLDFSQYPDRNPPALKKEPLALPKAEAPPKVEAPAQPMPIDEAKKDEMKKDKD